MRKSLTAVSSCGLLLFSLVAGPAQAAPNNQAAPDNQTACRVAEPDTARLGVAQSIDGGPAYTEWLGQARGRAFNNTVSRTVERIFGVPGSKERVAAQLRRGLIGTAIDHNTQTVVIVAAPEFPGVKALRSGLSAATAAPENIGMNVSVITGCRNAADLIEADDVLAARAWHSDAVRASFTYSLRAADSAFHVYFDSRYPAAAQALGALLGDRVVVTLSEQARTGRYDDGEPHFGGSGIRVNSGTASSNTCTSSFTFRRNVDGQKGVVSAGHCFNNSLNIYSGPQYTGYSWGKADYPNYDMIGVRSATETFDNVIHSDPCCPTQRNIIGRYHVKVGDQVCFSGMVTKATCGIPVTAVNGTACDADGCTPGLIEAIRNGDVIARGGDSGGPIYVRSGTSNAYASGMIIASAAGGTIAYGEHLDEIEYHLNVTLLTS